MNFEKQYEIIEKLDDMERLYVGHYPKGNRKYTVKSTNKDGGSYLYTWVNWGEGEHQKYSPELGRMVTRKNNGTTQTTHYVCSLNGKDPREENYYEYANEGTIEKIRVAKEMVEKQIKVISKRAMKLDPLYMGTLKPEYVEQATKEITAEYPELMNKGNAEDLERLQTIIDDEKKKKEMILLFVENKKREKEEKREERERQRQLNKAKKGV